MRALAGGQGSSEPAGWRTCHSSECSRRYFRVNERFRSFPDDLRPRARCHCCQVEAFRADPTPRCWQRRALKPHHLAPPYTSKFSFRTRPNLFSEFSVPLGPGREATRVLFSGFVLVVERSGDRQHPADRLDPVALAVLIDERHHHLGRRSSSAWAKNADALRRISFARLSSRTSRSSALSHVRSSVVSPMRLPVSRSA